MLGLVESGKTQRARLVCGGQGYDGLIFKLLIFADVTPDMDIFSEEIFGAVVAITSQQRRRSYRAGQHVF